MTSPLPTEESRKRLCLTQTKIGTYFSRTPVQRNRTQEAQQRCANSTNVSASDEKQYKHPVHKEVFAPEQHHPSGSSDSPMTVDDDEYDPLSQRGVCYEQSSLSDLPDPSMVDDADFSQIPYDYDEVDDEGCGRFPTEKECNITNERDTCQPNIVAATQEESASRDSQDPLHRVITNHHVLYTIPDRGHRILPPVPLSADVAGGDRWDDKHVRLPCSASSKHEGDCGTVSRWDVIVRAFRKQHVRNSVELEQLILSYNPHYSGAWDFTVLHHFFQEDLNGTKSDAFFRNVLPRILDLALKLPFLFPGSIPMLLEGENSAVSMTQEQVACLLCHGFMCTFPRRNSHRSKLPRINFNGLYGLYTPSKSEKLQCLVTYLTAVTTQMPPGVITVVRHALSLRDLPQWQTCSSTMPPLEVDPDTRIEDTGRECLQVDFANRFVGGGVLGRGAVQEEIRFVLSPELIVACLVCPAMAHNEAIVIKGAQRFSNYTGYARSFRFHSAHTDTRARDDWHRLETQVVAIDATAFGNAEVQYGERFVRRELNKCFCGLGTPHIGRAASSDVLNRLPCVATGNWGSGAFNGDVFLKSTLQLMVCAAAEKKMLYCTFGNRDLGAKLKAMHGILVDCAITVGELYEMIASYCELRQARRTSTDVIVYIMNKLRDEM
eukprot:m.692380 g.692380  ORF g.692380 m.692380 type:complete len:662 (+) comp22863_c0_seq5:285-2270(+)